MSNELLNVIQNIGGKANEMTHSLKEYGDGSMNKGITEMCMDAFADGKKEGTIKGVVIMTAIGIVAFGGKKLYDKFLKGNGKRRYNLTKEKSLSVQTEIDFPWDEVKRKMMSDYGVSNITFETWIQPLVCRAYEDKILLEFPCSSEMEVDYIRSKYKRMIEDIVYEVTGKKYKVSIVC